MAFPFFYHKDLNKTSAVLSLDEATSKHVVQVLRMKAGERISLTNGQGLLALTEISEVTKKSCAVTIIETHDAPLLVKRKTAIAISPVKNASRFEWFLEKATELGINEVIPLLCQRTEREHFRYERMNQICISAMLQSKQTYLPLLHQPIAFDDFVIVANNWQSKWIAHCLEDDKKDLANSLSNDMSDGLVLIGPEGDFTTQEINNAIGHGYKPVALGNTRLRTETAGLAAATLLALCGH
jgi:16S rRNA (uracil1498-N3)-methyltransferase